MWYVDDGYVGRDRPHYTEVDDDDLAECKTEEEKDELIESYIQEDFEQNISWYRAKED